MSANSQRRILRTRAPDHGWVCLNRFRNTLFCFWQSPSNMAIRTLRNYPKEDDGWQNLNGVKNRPAKAVARRSMTSRKKTSSAQNAALPLSPNPRPSHNARRPESPSRLSLVGASRPGRLFYRGYLNSVTTTAIAESNSAKFARLFAAATSSLSVW